MKKLFRLSLATEFIMKTLFLVTLVTNHTVGELNALLESVGLIKVEKAFYEMHFAHFKMLRLIHIRIGILISLEFVYLYIRVDPLPVMVNSKILKRSMTITAMHILINSTMYILICFLVLVTLVLLLSL